jgi:hypothetical protein
MQLAHNHFFSLSGVLVESHVSCVFCRGLIKSFPLALFLFFSLSVEDTNHLVCVLWGRTSMVEKIAVILHPARPTSEGVLVRRCHFQLGRHLGWWCLSRRGERRWKVLWWRSRRRQWQRGKCPSLLLNGEEVSDSRARKACMTLARWVISWLTFLRLCCSLIGVGGM